jgi:hypothetical protein
MSAAELPPIATLGRMIRDEANIAEVFTQAQNEAEERNQKDQERRADKGAILAYHREDTLRELALVQRARTIQDALIQLVLLHHVIDEIDHLDVSKINGMAQFEFLQQTRSLRRVMASVTPQVAVAAGLDLKDVAEEYVVNRIADEFPEA